MPNKNILITGGAGFIATAIAERLVEDNHLTPLDLNFAAGSPSTTAPSWFVQLTTVKGDIQDRALVDKAVANADAITHAAAVVGVYNVLKAVRATLETNPLGTVNLISGSRAVSRSRRIHLFSTSEVFGGSSFRVGEAALASIGSIDEAPWSYSISKLAGEHLAFAYY